VVGDSVEEAPEVSAYSNHELNYKFRKVAGTIPLFPLFLGFYRFYEELFQSSIDRRTCENWFSREQMS